jgi:hypothetical protein
MQTQPLTSVAEEWFRGLFRKLFFALESLRACGRLPSPAGPVFLRLDRIYHLVLRIAALVRDGRYKPRRRTGRPRPPARRRARPPDPLPLRFGWLAALLPATAAGLRGDLSVLLERPDMVALIQAAPVTLIRPLRSLCWALHFKPPPILARPRKAARPTPVPQPAAPLPDSPPRSPNASPLQLSPPALPQRSRSARAASPARSPPPAACGPPHPA